MGLFDKIKKAVSGGSPAPAPKTGGQGGGNRQGGNRQGGQGGNRQGGNRQGQGGNRQGQGGSGEGSGQGGNRRRGSRGGRGRGAAGGNSHAQGQGGAQAQERQGQGGNRQQGQGGNRNRGGQRGNRNQGEGRDAQSAEGSSGQSSNARRRRRGGRGRGSGSGQGGQGSGNGGTRTVTRSDAAELKEKQGENGESKSSSSSRRRSRGGRSGGGSNRSGSGRGRERTRRGSSSSGSHRRVLDANERPKNPVKKQILINAQDPNEIRVAIREQQQVVEVYVERKGKRSLAGNIYKGRVQNVLPGMEACFVDVGLERNGFLYVDEITPAAADSDQVMKVGMVTEVEAGNSPEDVMEDAATTHGETLEMADAMAEEDAEQAAAGEAAEGEGDAAKKDGGAKGRGRARIRNKQKIQDLLKQGQEILVQVVKDPMGTKGSRLTTQYSLAGRYLVFVPDGEGLGVSRRLEDAERNRLREIVKQFELPWGGGLIVRTAAEGARDEDIAKDLDLLLRLHEQLMEKAGDARAPKLLYNEADLSLRIIRDLFNGEVEEVLVDDERQFQRITNYLKRTSPELAERVRMHDGQRPLFESYGVDEAIKSTLSKRADLPSGGYLILDKTEAFHVIDVNSGRNVGKASLEETITKTNMEAAAEVVRQLRLRDLGGIIVIDFIDMNQMKNRDAVLEHFRTELSKDRTKTYLVEISPLGLVEMTRQNVSEGVREILTSTCRTCEGRGVQISPETHAIEVERALIDLAAGLGSEIEAVAVDAQPDVAKALAGNQSKQSELDKRAGKHIRVLADPDLTPNTFALRATGSMAVVEAAPEPLLRGSKHKVLIEKVDPSCEEDGIANIGGIMVTVIGAAASVGEEKTIVIAACSGTRAFATLVKPARRRRRRGGRGRKKTAVGAAGAESVETEELQSDVDAESGDEAEGDEEFEEFDEDEDLADETAAEAVEIDDERTEIPQRLVLLDEEDDAEDEDVDGSDADEDDDQSDDSDDDSDSSSDEDPDDDHDGPSGGADADADSGSDGDGDSEDEDSHLDPTSAVDGADDAKPLAVRRESVDDRDEPSIDADGSDAMLAERGVTAIKTSSVSVGNGTAPQAGAAPALGPDGQPRKRRRRGSRGGRNRNRSGASGQKRPAGSSDGGDNSSSNSQSSSASSSDS